MAAVSPIIVHSSSPNSFRAPSITPRSSKKLISSSPGLPSPSAFVKPRAPGLKSGSRAGQLPEEASRGFASAGSLWRLNQFEHEQDDDGREVLGEGERGRGGMGAESRSKQSGGKLVKPKKVRKTEEQAESSTEGHDDVEIRESAHFGATKSTSKAPADLPPPEVRDETHERQNRARGARISLSAFAFEVPEDGKKTESITKISKPAKKPRRTKTKTAEGDNEAPAKKPRKRKAKSASIILNSDEPDVDDALAPGTAYVRPQQPITAELTAAPDVLKQKPTIEKNSREKQAESEWLSPEKTKLPEQHHGSQIETSNGNLPAAQKSVYFTGPTLPKALQAEGDASPSPSNAPIPTPTEAAMIHAQAVDVAEAASRRRRSWTPVKDTTKVALPTSRPATAGSEFSDASHTPKLQLTDILGSFGYVANDMQPANSLERETTGEAVTKRRRIELSAPVSVVAAPTKEVSVSSVQKPTKRAKAPKKKAQTITALATAAFQPAKDGSNEDSTVSSFFAARKDEAAGQQANDDDPQPTMTKPKKPRKPRAKPTATDAQGASAKPKRASRPQKVKTKFNEADYLPKLYSPTRASIQLKNQDLLFGTSSQLAVDESPSFIRDMQAAIRESEAEPYDVGMSQVPLRSQGEASPRSKSFVKVPTAPHGTCLSVKQAERELWCVSCRDSVGGVLRSEKSTSGTTRVDDGAPGTDQVVVAGALDAQEEPVKEDTIAARVVVDLCDTSPAAPAPEVKKRTESEEAPVGDLQAEPSGPPASSSPLLAGQAAVEEDDSWMLLQSDDPEPVAGLSDATTSRMPLSPLRASPRKMATTHSIFVSSSRLRPPLSPLNPNANLFAETILEKHAAFSPSRLFSSTATNHARKSRSPSGRPRGRPRKDTAAVSPPQQISPKRRGRPPEQPPLASDPSPHTSKAKKQKTAASASQPLPRSEWIDIDEISDSDSPTTPSPPRRRASASPPAVQPLPLIAAGSPSIKAKAPALAAPAAPALRSGDSHWSTIRETLFPRITSAVKSAPHSTDPIKPSWWEKILLYDPIVLEDLTAWLNEQGVRVEIQRQKAKPKKRGRKRKDADAEAEEEDVEWEVHQEELKPWMVQKWCEEKSVCCLWKEGLRGGVRTRY